MVHPLCLLGSLSHFSFSPSMVVVLLCHLPLTSISPLCVQYHHSLDICNKGSLCLVWRWVSGNVPAPLPFRLIPTTPDTPFPDPAMRCQTAHRKLSERQYPSTAGNCNSSHVSIPLMSSLFYYINRLPLQGLTQSSSHKSIPVKVSTL